MLSMLVNSAKVLFMILGIAALQPVALANQAAESEKPADRAPEKKLDLFGDPLPDGALARMGTVRWRHPAPITFVGFTAKGKQLLTACADGLYRIWDRESGKELRHIREGAKPTVKLSPVAIQAGVANLRMGWAGIAGAGLALSPDGEILAASGPGGIYLRSVVDGKELRTLTTGNHPAGQGVAFGVNGMAFSADGKAIVVRGFDQAIHVLDVTTGKELGKILNQQQVGQNRVAFINAAAGGKPLAFTASGNELISTAAVYENQKITGVIHVHEVKTAKQLRELKLPFNNANAMSIAIAPDGKTSAWALTDGTIVLYETEAGKELGQLRPEKMVGYMTNLAYSPDGKLLASRRSNNPGITLWDTVARKQLRVLGQAPESNIAAGNIIVVGGFGGGYVASSAFAFSPDGTTIAEATAGNSIRLWNVADGKEVTTASAAKGHHGSVSQLVVAGKELVTTGTDGSVRRWDLGNGKELGHVRLPADAAGITLSANGKNVICSTNANKVRVVATDTGNELRVFDLPAPQQGFIRYGAGTKLALSPDGKLLAIRGYNQAVRIFDTVSGKLVHDLSEQTPGPNPNGAVFVSTAGFGGLGTMVFSPNGRQLAVAGGNAGAVMGAGGVIGGTVQPTVSNSIQLHDFAQGKKARHFDSRPAAILDMAFAPDIRSIVTANSDNTVSLWESLTGKECLQIKLGTAEQPGAQNAVANIMVNRRFLYGGIGATRCLALVPDGRTVAIASEQAIRLWDLRTGKELGKFQGHGGQVTSLAFAADSKTLISGSADTTALVWDAGRFIKSDEQIPELSEQQVAELWKDLAGDPSKAYQAIIALRRAPQQAVSLFGGRLKPAAGVDAKRIDQLISDLEKAEYKTRQKAMDELEKLGELARPALRQAISKGASLEMRRRLDSLLEKIVNDKVPPPDVLRSLRAILILQDVGTPESRRVLQTLAQGAPGHRLTRHAQAALNPTR